ncbi:alpha-1,4-N-acetyl-D-galactosaminyltransferase [Planctomycetes bacterium CA13]|uniref:Alpha-1,4-N-acetyl-D-galactosaminyltransferase n=1 Tax=Novipirellula herctigrandis TaxID=2527986 RepID=A0A5C5YVZ5_9BACT|nr:alpha-1,4-N-acetyl-D-galactosaminyltransferase [Planctomycetes bacterium CA13]
MKILCIIHSLDGGGAERVMARLASMLAARNHQVALVTLDDAKNDRHSVSDSVRRLPLGVMSETPRGFAKLRNIRRRLSAIRRTVKHESPDVVLSFCDRTNIDVLLATIGMNVPVVISERSDPRHQNLGTFWERVRRKIYPRAAKIVALTNAIAESLAPLNHRPVEVIPSAVDKFDAAEISGARKNVILGVGRLQTEKGFDRLIEAFAEIAADSPEWTLRIVGEGTQRGYLEELAKTRGISDRIAFPGWVRPIDPEYAGAAVFVLPSRYEGFPSALLEAMAAGLPCIAMDCQSGSREIIRDGENGLIVADSIPDLTAALRHLVDNPTERERVAKSATEVATQFSWDKMVDKYENLLRIHLESLLNTH